MHHHHANGALNLHLFDLLLSRTQSRLTQTPMRATREGKGREGDSCCSCAADNGTRQGHAMSVSGTEEARLHNDTMDANRGQGTTRRLGLFFSSSLCGCEPQFA